MKKIILLLEAITIGYANAYAQSCLPEGIFFNTQEQIDNFQANYPGCAEIEGFVKITGADITNLNGAYLSKAIYRILKSLNLGYNLQIQHKIFET